MFYICYFSFVILLCKTIQCQKSIEITLLWKTKYETLVITRHFNNIFHWFVKQIICICWKSNTGVKIEFVHVQKTIKKQIVRQWANTFCDKLVGLKLCNLFFISLLFFLSDVVQLIKLTHTHKHHKKKAENVKKVSAKRRTDPSKYKKMFTPMHTKANKKLESCNKIY